MLKLDRERQTFLLIPYKTYNSWPNPAFLFKQGCGVWHLAIEKSSTPLTRQNPVVSNCRQVMINRGRLTQLFCVKPVCRVWAYCNIKRYILGYAWNFKIIFAFG